MTAATRSVGERDALLVGGVSFLVVAAPILAFPDVVSATWRMSAVTAATLTALGLGTAILWQWKRFRLSLWLFVFSLVSAWTLVPAHELPGLRHFAGTGLGVLAMAVVARWCTGTDRIVVAGSVFALVSTGILVVGSVGAAANLNTLKFIRWNQMLTLQQMEAVSSVGLGLPGMEEESKGGRVNPNALGGTALLVLPTCAGLVAASLTKWRRRRMTLAIAGMASTVAAAVMAITLSRTAWAAAITTLALIGLRWRRSRPWVVLALVVVAAGLASGVHFWRAADAAGFDSSLTNSINERSTLWLAALRRLRESPWLGIGISSFRGADTGGGSSGLEVPHAHNIWLQTALDVGLLGLLGYVSMLGTLLWGADQAARRSGEVGRIAAGAGLSLLAVHLFGMTDAIALGAKVGIFQWLCAGLILAAAHRPGAVSPEPVQSEYHDTRANALN